MILSKVVIIVYAAILFSILHSGWYMLSLRISESVPVRQLADTELRNEPRSLGAQLAYHQTPPCNMYFLSLHFLIF